jgi:phosphoglycerol transferase
MYQMKNGSNPLVANRSFIESEIYGLKIIQLILPRLGHRVGIFSALAQNKYRAGSLGK